LTFYNIVDETWNRVIFRCELSKHSYL